MRSAQRTCDQESLREQWCACVCVRACKGTPGLPGDSGQDHRVGWASLNHSFPLMQNILIEIIPFGNAFEPQRMSLPQAIWVR